MYNCTSVVALHFFHPHEKTIFCFKHLKAWKKSIIELRMISWDFSKTFAQSWEIEGTQAQPRPCLKIKVIWDQTWKKLVIYLLDYWAFYTKITSSFLKFYCHCLCCKNFNLLNIFRTVFKWFIYFWFLHMWLDYLHMFSRLLI